MSIHKKKDELPWKLILIAILIAFIIVIGIYVFNFYGHFGDQEKFGQFGDFLGGTLNPILTTLTIVLLILSLRDQRKELALSREELALTRKELEKSAKALESSSKHQQDMLDLQTNTEKRRELEDNIKYSHTSLKSRITELRSLPKTATSKEKDDVIVDILSDFASFFDSTRNVHAYLYTPSAKIAKYRRAIETIKLMEELDFINQENVNTLEAILSGVYHDTVPFDEENDSQND